MRIMRLLLTAFAFAAIPGSCSLAQDKPGAHAPQGTESVETVKNEYEDAMKAFFAEFRVATEEAEKNGKEIRRRSGRNTATSSLTFPSAARSPRSRSRPLMAATRSSPASRAKWSSSTSGRPGAARARR